MLRNFNLSRKDSMSSQVLPQGRGHVRLPPPPRLLSQLFFEQYSSCYRTFITSFINCIHIQTIKLYSHLLQPDRLYQSKHKKNQQCLVVQYRKIGSVHFYSQRKADVPIFYILVYLTLNLKCTAPVDDSVLLVHKQIFDMFDTPPPAGNRIRLGYSGWTLYESHLSFHLVANIRCTLVTVKLQLSCA